MKTQHDLVKELNRLFEELNRLHEQKQKLFDKGDAILLKIRSIQNTLDLLKSNVPPQDAESKLASALDENSKLGDAIEVIVDAMGPLRRKEIIEILRKYRVRISPKNPEQVLATAIFRDREGRFEILKDKRVGLKGEKK